ncbi:hypothetical protein 2011_scaffold13_00017 [Bacteriophage sp.]|nr:hypothetical protein 2011_scaffold13_00017 [Bacteriophage sp.]
MNDCYFPFTLEVQLILSLVKFNVIHDIFSSVYIIRSVSVFYFH